MEKGSKLIIIALAAVLIISLMFVFQTNVAKQNVIREYKDKSESLKQENASLQSQFEQINREKRKLEDKLMAIQSDINRITSERDEWKSKYDLVSKEKEDLIEKIKTKPIAAETSTQAVPGVSAESYWAEVLKEKADLELKLQDLKDKLDNTASQLQDVQKEKSDAELQLSSLQQVKEELERKVTYNQQLVASLSTDLAREKSDKVAILQQIDNIKKENLVLRRQVKDLSTAKLALEKGLKKLEKEKDELDKRITTTEQILAGRMNELLEMKQDIESSLGLEMTAKEPQPQAAVELPPIVVRAGGEATAPTEIPKKTGKILSINEENNFVIIDMGEDNGVVVGDIFRVFKKNKHIATVEVIQIRKDICAADIKYSAEKIAVDDLVSTP
jgi:predicted  nucleic acid-binding Zn-ribbon protein